MTEYYVNHSGNDGNSGLSESLAWRTLAYAEDQLVAGDKVWVKSDEAYTDEDGSNDCVLYIDKIGTAYLPITFEGYKTTPGDGDSFLDGSGRFKVDASGFTYGVKLYATTISGYRVIKNAEVFGASSVCINTLYSRYVSLDNLLVYNSGGLGIYTNSNTIISRSSIHSCASGVKLWSAWLFDCDIYNNSVIAIETVSYPNYFMNVRFWGNSEGIATIQESFKFTNCTFDCNSGYGIKYRGTLKWSVLCHINNCIFYDATQAIYAYEGSTTDISYVGNNCFYSVTDAYTNWANTVGCDVLADPLFTDAANHDYTLQAGSPCIGAGVNGTDIGAYGYTAPAASSTIQVLGIKLK